MTHPFRGHRARNGRRPPVFDGDFPDGDRDITEALPRVIPAWDGATYGTAGRDTEPFGRYRQPKYRAVTIPAPAAGPGVPAPGPRPDPSGDIIGRDTARGWPHLFELRCAYPAANHPTPIPCGNTHRDDTTGSLHDLRASAYAAGWHVDAFGQWACPRCCQDNPAYRTLYPLTHWHPDAAQARLDGVAAAEFWFGVEAECAVWQRTKDAAIHGRHQRAGTP